jgi:hypothetical protein
MLTETKTQTLKRAVSAKIVLCCAVGFFFLLSLAEWRIAAVSSLTRFGLTVLADCIADPCDANEHCVIKPNYRECEPNMTYAAVENTNGGFDKNVKVALPRRMRKPAGKPDTWTPKLGIDGVGCPISGSGSYTMAADEKCHWCPPKAYFNGLKCQCLSGYLEDKKSAGQLLTCRKKLVIVIPKKQ